ncbi:MAG: tRNA (adenosine(37)-N6)-dimethylallyltransferase MiaA [Anaerolineae bacterium]|nr:tRNA (adenosine(37)-N6)-dimethylallyltransferase MiaA [Anaerolineae bacterium]
MSRPLIVIVGPTAVGKTAVAIPLARHAGGEIVSADSRQIYRGMDIGTAKPTAAEQAQVRHHLIDVVDPDQTLTLAEYQQLAYAAIDDILCRGRRPFLVGGTGLYVRSVAEGWTVPHVPPNPVLRAVLLERAEREGPSSLHAELQAVDPVGAQAIDPRNVRRVVRALEVYYGTGEPPSRQQARQPPPYAILWIGLTMPRTQLYARADARIDAMLAAGWVDEVRDLLARGYHLDLPAMSALGYREIGTYLRGEISLEEAVALIKRHTRRFIRHQYAWFGLDDPRLHWFDVSEPCLDRIRDLVTEWLGTLAS